MYSYIRGKKTLNVFSPVLLKEMEGRGKEIVFPKLSLGPGLIKPWVFTHTSYPHPFLCSLLLRPYCICFFLS